ncbi:hypothetical protein ACQKPE_15945 [Pseudomonas sp. NPDC089554]|uniref:hypothetical protein n=1 Tax=Pseudomonas sp. NPDC089554 TaxID=3390653 RepID=UPI003D03C694
MSNIHDQAMHYIYQQVLQRVLDHMSQAQRASVQLLIQRLLVAAGGLEYIGEFRLLVLHANDPRSARLLATLRAAQLSIALRGPETFHLRVVVACQPALRNELLDDHERAFSALFLQEDPRVELLMLKAGQVQPFSARLHATDGSLPGERQGMLLFGHLSGGRPEALLGSRLHLELADACQQLLAWKGGASALITAIPERQRRRYLAWARSGMRLAGERGLPGAHPCAGALCEALGRLHRVAASPLDSPTTPGETPSQPSALRLIAIDELLPPQGDNDRVVQMLGLRHLAIASGTPLGAFFDPLALAHLRGLHAQLLQGAGESPCSQSMHEQARALLQQTYGIGDTQLACLLFTPFNHRGRGLGLFLKRCHPSMRVALPYLHQALQGKPCPDTVQQWLLDTSGLSMAQLRALYAGNVAPSAMRLLDSLALRDAHLRLLPRLEVFREAKTWAVT